VTQDAKDRAETLEHLRTLARRAFEKRPETRSLLFAVAQYWNDQADDEVHDFLVSSPRDVPAWPHFCEMYDEDGGLATPGEHCNQSCDLELGGIGVWPETWARFCHESGSQDRNDGENFTPYAIARRRGDGDQLDFEVEVIGKLWRPEEDLLPDEPEAGRRWLDLPRAQDLYALVCESPGDDGPRRVLGDYLLEHEHPRGELIALSLSDRLTASSAAADRHRELLETHGRQWLSPLGAVIPEAGAHWERGFLARADVYLRDGIPDAIRGAPAWGTVETIRFLRGDLIDPAMVALRDVGPVRDGLRALAEGPRPWAPQPGAPRPWAIARLHAVLEDAQAVDALWGAATLPRLTHLALEGPQLAAALERPRPRWWPQLQRLTLILDCDTSATALEEWRWNHARIAPWVAVTRRSSITCDLGWEVATGPGHRIEITLAGWHEAATRFTLWEIVDELPRDAEVWLAPSRHWAPLPEDADRLAATAGRPIRLAAP
jgi:uncharacterized protein (TIGR02996 family)